MSGNGRGHAVERRVRPHAPIPDPLAPGCCSVCSVPLTAKNKLHTDRPPAVEAHQAVEHARLADRD